LKGADGRPPAEKLVILGFSISLLILAAVGFFSYRATRHLIETDISIGESHEAFDQVDALLLEVLEVESAAHSYLLGGKDFYLQPYYAALSRIDQTFRKLQKVTEDNPRLQTRVLAMRGPIENKLAYHRKQIEARSASGVKSTTGNLPTGVGHELMDQIRGIADEVKGEEKVLMARQEAEARSAAHQSVYLLASGSLLALAIFLLIYWNLIKEISRRKRTEATLIHLNRLHLVLSRVGQVISQVRERGELLSNVTRVLSEDNAGHFKWIGLFDAQSGLLEATAGAGAAERFLRMMPISTGEASAERTAVTEELIHGKHFLCNDTRSDALCKNLVEEFLSFGLFPILAGSRPTGALGVLSRDAGYFDPETTVLLDQLAASLSLAMEAIEAEDKRRNMVEQIRKMNEELEQRVRQRTEELAIANSELALRNQEVEKANRLKSEFLANMSHELRTPLNAIIGFSDLLAEDKAGTLQAKQQRFVGHIRDGAQHLLKLINEVLDISKIEAGHISLEPGGFGAADALTEVLVVISPLADSKRIQVDSNVADELTIFADRIHFKQILYNLLSNALKFTPELGKVWVDALCEADGCIRFTVADSGMGIPAEELESIFDEFRQLHEKTKVAGEGFGLGLAITRRLVKLNGGRIWVRSEPGKGSAFSFTLPSTSSAQSAGLSSGSIQ
jgi:signal transduction histidine kinase